MIDNKINKALSELEANLMSLDSAREQVEKTVKSYNGLNSTTSEYVENLGMITKKIHELVDSIGKDYAQKVSDFEKDRETVINTSNEATERLSKASDEFKVSLSDVKTKLKYSLFINALSLITIAAIIVLLLK